MKILKYKKKRNGQYEIQLDSGKDLCLYEEVILNFSLLLKKNIDEEELDEILLSNQEYDVYYVALKSLKNRFKSVKELRISLLKKEYPVESVESAIHKLLSQGYLDDRSFAKAYINTQMITTSKGPKKIEKELLEKGVSRDIIVDELAIFTKDEQIIKIEKIANRLVRSNRSRGGIVLRKKIIQDLHNMGYSGSIVEDVLSSIDFGDTKDIAKNETEKLYQRLSRKYSGKELEFKIKEKLYQKGLYYED
ncbi:MAG: RecX family transcriptional regulator [bacterium]|nr:RecX family transcriptional regulator [Mycoplasmatota bacterium]MDD6756518.1 RecX family transcriptional regulator [bacterium]MDY2908763.1 RecX family transcriptional regulator [Candidatus Faecimonas sp.]